jgi:hypothetical protein
MDLNIAQPPGPVFARSGIAALPLGEQFLSSARRAAAVTASADNARQGQRAGNAAGISQLNFDPPADVSLKDQVNQIVRLMASDPRTALQKAERLLDANPDLPYELDDTLRRNAMDAVRELLAAGDSEAARYAESLQLDIYDNTQYYDPRYGQNPQAADADPAAGLEFARALADIVPAFVAPAPKFVM